jgi:hypothetical protein
MLLNKDVVETMSNDPETTTKPPAKLAPWWLSGQRQAYTKAERDFPGATILRVLEDMVGELDLTAAGLDDTERDLVRLRAQGAGWRRSGRRVGLDHMTAKRRYIAAMQRLARHLMDKGELL